jgi:predicted membrane metal-binding protein
VTGSDGNWHETLDGDGPGSGSSDRAFGLLFAAVCGVIAVLAVWQGRRSAAWWSLAAVLFLVLAVFAAPLLGPLNRAWRWVSLQLSRIVSPLVMSLMFFAVLTPIGWVMRRAGNDPLRLRFAPEQKSYWLARPLQGDQTAMTKQF